MNSNRDSSGKSAAAGVALGIGATAVGAFMAEKIDAKEIPSNDSQTTQVGDGKSQDPNPQQTTFEGDINWLTEANYTINTEEQLLQFLETAEANGLPLDEITKIDALIRHNLENGIDVTFSSEYGSGYLGTYDPTSNLITIMPETVDMGYEDLLKVLTHETVHAEQDMADGLDNDTLQMIGSEINAHGIYNVETYYNDVSYQEQLLELEANSAEVDIEDTFEHIGVDV